jgi:hypothetical protein
MCHHFSLPDAFWGTASEADMDTPAFFQMTLGGLLGSSLATTILGALFLRWSKTVESEIKAHFDQSIKVFESTRAWKQQSLSELLGPLNMHF